MAQMRLQRFLAQGGIAARRKAEVLITEGRVKVNGKVVKELGTKVDPDADRVMVNGQPVSQQELYYLVFNKPKGCITAVSDPEGRRTVMEYMPGLPSSVVPVGRLDFYSEGVLLLTNDGVLAAALTSSRREIEKSYHVKLKGSIDDREIKKLRDGVRLDYRTTTKPAQVDRLKSTSRHDWLIITITEGKNRQLHRMLEAVGHEIIKLQRVAFAGLSYYGLRVGDARELNQSEVKELFIVANLSRSKGLTSRGKWAVKRETTEKARRNADRARDRLSPNLTPGGSKKARTKLLTRYREQEEDGTAPAVPVPLAVARAKAAPKRKSGSAATTKAKPGPKRKGASTAKPGPKRKGASAAKPGPKRRGASTAKPGPKRKGASAAKPGPKRKSAAASKGKRTSRPATPSARGTRKNATSKPSAKKRVPSAKKKPAASRSKRR